MVYQGPSRGCISCRQKRKKCDETRPSCMRCTKAGRTCGGYEDTAASAFRASEKQQSPFVSIARKCSLPPRVPIPGSHVLPEDAAPADQSQAAVDSFSLRGFLYDFCVVSTNSSLSRGYLSGLEPMVRRSGPHSNLAKACEAVAFAQHGKPLGRPKLLDRAAVFYQELLGYLAKTLPNPDTANAIESKIIVMLLGLYQMVVASEEDHGCHETHAKGLAALLGIGNSHLSLLHKRTGIFSVHALGGDGLSLDDLLLSLDRLETKSEAAYGPEDIKMLRDECIALERRFGVWQTTRVQEFKPIAVGHIGQTNSASATAVGYWPGTVDTYFDLYVAGVWNIFRSARLLLISLSVKLSEALGESCWDYIRTATGVVQDIIASVPYHLTENLPAFIAELDSSKEIRDPGRFLGGLLMVHPLDVASKMHFLPEETREYLRSCLFWIGSHMGIGQATLLAKTPTINRDYLASGCMIVWSGFLW